MGGVIPGDYLDCPSRRHRFAITAQGLLLRTGRHDVHPQISSQWHPRISLVAYLPMHQVDGLKIHTHSQVRHYNSAMTKRLSLVLQSVAKQEHMRNPGFLSMGSAQMHM